MSIDLQTIQNLGLGAKPADAQKSNELGQDLFFKLMVTQLNNQNPLKPQEGKEFLGQLAQFGTVTGIQDLQKTFADFVANMNQGQSLMAAGLVGKSVMIQSNQAVLGASGELRGAATVPAGGGDVRLRVLDAKGGQVYAADLGERPAGLADFAWNGYLPDGVTHAPPGLYTVQAEAMVDGQNAALDTQVGTPVQSVILGGTKGIQVDLGALGLRGLSDIREIL
jgi:flagellar basal-body rod modification protein FlgD